MKNKKNSNIDLSSKLDSFTSYLIKHIPTIHKKTHAEMITIVMDSRNHVSISPEYLQSVINKMNEIQSRKGAVPRYLGDIILKGSNLGVVQTAQF